LNPPRVRSPARRLAWLPESAAPVADTDLLGRFLDAHDEAAFTALAARHLPTVRAVCRSVLRDPNDADDAVQATFLVLVRRAGAVRNRAALGAWLARVAWRAANRLRETNTRRSAMHSVDTDPDDTPAPATTARTELAAALHEEIARLPERYRLAVLACYAAGTPTADAARQLGWPKGTLLTRLAWARRRLRARLGIRGLPLAGGFAVVFAPRVGRVGAALLAGRIGRSALLLKTGDPLVKVLIPGRVASLTEGVVRTMMGTKLKVTVAAGLVAVALLGLGLGRMTAEGQPPSGTKLNPPAASTPAATAPAAEPHAKAAKAEAGDLVVRRPRGSYTREVPGYGKATFTFTDGHLHAAASVRIEDASFVVTLEGDYAMNAESTVFGVISSAEVQGSFPADEAAEVAYIAGAAADVPFAFRVRVEDDAVTVKDIRFGAIGSPAFMKAIEAISADDEGIYAVLGILAGKYRADPNPTRPAPPAGPPPAAPARSRSRTNRSDAGPGGVPGPVLPVTPGPALGQLSLSDPRNELTAHD
jgi:RNA polymerase sigma factor (sigma-70 family)